MIPEYFPTPHHSLAFAALERTSNILRARMMAVVAHISRRGSRCVCSGGSGGGGGGGGGPGLLYSLVAVYLGAEGLALHGV